MLQHIFKNFEILNMLVYSRNTLISLRNWHKTFKFFTQSHGSVVRPASSEVWQRLAFYSLLAPTRGQRGGSHLKDHRPIKTVQLSDRRKNFSVQNVPNRSNFLNIQVRTDGIKSVTTTTDARRKSNSDSKLKPYRTDARAYEGEEI